MRVPRVRFTVRWMMVAVAVVASVAGGERLAQRRAYFLEMAEIEEDRANDYVICPPCLREEYDKPGMYEKLANFYSARARIYRQAAARPWLAVEPDPPRPKP